VSAPVRRPKLASSPILEADSGIVKSIRAGHS
jgi:hypothetical protein